jgi:hypothetical protein
MIFLKKLTYFLVDMAIAEIDMLHVKRNRLAGINPLAI